MANKKKVSKSESQQGSKRKSTRKFWTRNLDIPLVVATIILILVGMLTLLSASSSIGLTDTGDPYFYVKKQTISLLIGIVGAIVMMFVNYKKFNNKIILLSIMILMLSLIAIVKISGIDEYGATRWVNILGFNFQPSEFIKLGMIIFMAGFLNNLIRKRKIKTFWKGFISPLIIAVFVAGLIFQFQNHLSAALVIIVVTVIQMLVAGINLFYFFAAAGIGLTGATVFLVNVSSETSGFRAERILAWRNPEQYSQGKGYQILQSLYAIGSGGLFGLGVGASRQKQDLLPFPQNDFIASIFAEEFGFIGVALLLILFVFLLSRGVKIAYNTKDIFGKLLAIGITGLFAVEIVFNLFVITNIIPVTGIGLPFFSYGGTAMIVNLLAIGILLNIHRVSNRKEG